MVWGEDALAFKFFVLTNLFDLHLVVSDDDLQFASATIQNSLPYQVFTGIHKWYFESILLDPSQPKAFPRSLCLELTTPRNERSVDDPEMVFIHPQSQFYFNIHDRSCSVSLPPFPENIRFPTRIAFLDSLIATYLDPPTGRINSRLTTFLKNVDCLSFHMRNELHVFPAGDLEPE